MEGKVVLYPITGVSHIIPMVQLAKLFLKHGISVEIAVINPPVMPTSTTNFISKVSTTNPEIKFNLLPPLPPPPKPPTTPISTMLNTIQSNNTQLQSYLQSLSETTSVSALVIDFFCVDALNVAAALEIPVYTFYTSGANDLAVLLRVPELVPTWDHTKKDVGKNPVVIPGIPLLHASDLPHLVLQFNTEDHELLINVFKRMAETKGIFINTFELLEPRAVKTLKDGLCLSTRPTPPTYCIGPLVTAPQEGVAHPSLRWLDSQQKNSVVLLSFGSSGNFPINQLQEIAFGIEKSGQKFIWVVRNPESASPDGKPYDPLAEPDLGALLPEGFLNRTKEQGIVVKSWAPQVEILRHEAVGGFVSHCGWSSTLEAITNGVPIICWPLFAEQKMNRVFLIEEIKIGVELKGCDEGLVSRDELAEKLRWLMQSEGGQELRNNVNAHRINGLEALREGGTSERAFLEFKENLKLQNV
ncbi:Glycosyltransferase [Rhynchospora pubera]|uniref:Glycosyltransferase n=1 Tax=Rhynchospora pubera TaxID=906938 RepID=A0AAV8GVE0_9POAL|nr:Glycosyltransferase [Rhynchospora pubera]